MTRSGSVRFRPPPALDAPVRRAHLTIALQTPNRGRDTPPHEQRTLPRALRAPVVLPGPLPMRGHSMHRTVVTLIGLAALAAPLGAQSVAPIPIESYSLDNGLKV